MTSIASTSSSAPVFRFNVGSPPGESRDVIAASSPRGGGVPTATDTAVAPQTQPAKPMAPKQVDNLVAQMQHNLSAVNSDLQFSVDQDTGSRIIKVVERTTSKVIWQFPTDQALQVAKELEQFQKGLMLNRQV